MKQLDFMDEVRRIAASLTMDDIRRAIEGRPKRVSKGYRPKMLPTLALSLNIGPKGAFGEFLWRLNVTDNPRGKFIAIARRDTVLLALNATTEGVYAHLNDTYPDDKDVWTKIFKRYCKVRGIVWRQERKKRRR